MAPDPRAVHALPVTSGVQRGLPGVVREEAPLPSEVVVSGVLLADRRREAHARVREMMGDCPEGFEDAEWLVLKAAYAPAPVDGIPGTASARAELLARARACFPACSPPEAARLYREALARPHVAAALADLRALEMLDVQEQRGLVREALAASLRLAEALTPDLALADPSGAAKLSLAVTAAAKALVDLDGLRAPAAGEDGGAGGHWGSGDGRADPGAALADKVGRILSDLDARKIPCEILPR